MVETVEYTPPPTVARFMYSDAPVRLLLGPVGSAKSTACVMELLRRARMQDVGSDGFRRTRGIIVRNTRQQLKDTTLKTVMDWLPNGQAGTWRESDMTYTIRLGDVISEWLFRPLDTPDDVRRLLSLEPTFAWINEFREIPEEVVTGLRSRLGRYPSPKMGGVTWAGLIGDSNFPDMDTYWHQVTDTDIPEGWEVFKQPGGLDPRAENLENLKQTPLTLTWSTEERRVWGREQYYGPMLNGSSQDWIDVMVHAKYGRSLSGRPVYERSFIPDFHVAKEPLQVIRSAPVVIGMDFGRSPAAVFKQMDAKGRVLTLAEVHSDNSGLEDFLRKQVIPVLRTKFPDNRVLAVGDPTGWYKGQLNEQTVADYFRAVGIPAKEATTNDPERRIAAVEKLLATQVEGGPGYLVCPTLTWLITGFRHGYRYKRKTDGSYEDKPCKTGPWGAYSHAHDANQYADLQMGLGASGFDYMPRRREIVQVSLAAYT